MMVFGCSAECSRLRFGEGQVPGMSSPKNPSATVLWRSLPDWGPHYALAVDDSERYSPDCGSEPTSRSRSATITVHDGSFNRQGERYSPRDQ